MAPVRQPDGKMTVPDEVIHSMESNKIGLKGGVNKTNLGGPLTSMSAPRPTGNPDWQRSCLTESHPETVKLPTRLFHCLSLYCSHM